MPGVSQAVFAAQNLDRDLVNGKSVIDVGAKDFNGSLRPLLEHWQPREYTGVDIVPGKGVDRIISATDLHKSFGDERFDIVLCAEMLEHAGNWQSAVENMCRVLKVGGHLLLTTRSFGYPYHGFPNDFWRFELQDMREIFADFKIIKLESDSISPGVFIFAQKTASSNKTNDLAVHCMVTGKKESRLPERYEQTTYFRKLAFKHYLKHSVERFHLWCGALISRWLGFAR